jgi:hypothetical protein
MELRGVVPEGWTSETDKIIADVFAKAQRAAKPHGLPGEGMGPHRCRLRTRLAPSLGQANRKQDRRSTYENLND